MIWDYFYLFWQSSLIETVIYFAFYRGRLSLNKVFILVTAANAITHPVVVFGFMGSSLSYLSAILLAELFAVVVESIVHHRAGALPLRLTTGAALAANLVSWQMGPILTYVLFF